nr:uncharacterized protein LOC109168459 [Ipomoea batatas]
MVCSINTYTFTNIFTLQALKIITTKSLCFRIELLCSSLMAGQFILASELRSPCNNKAIRVRTVRTYATLVSYNRKKDWFGLDDFADFEMIGFNDGGSSGSVRVTLERFLMDEFNQEEDHKRIKGSVVKMEKM